MKKLIHTLIVSSCLLGANVTSSALTLGDLKRDPTLTPERLIRLFADFSFELRDEVQAPQTFLESKAGDCDDFATLASQILRAKGYTTRLVVVFMPRDIHVVCYVEETGSYLDFNNRGKAAPLVVSDNSLSAIAEKVAESFGSTWHCASEFEFHDGVRRFVYTDFRQAEKPKTAPVEAAEVLVVDK